MNEWDDITDEQVLDWCDSQMTDEQQTELSELLGRNRENQLTTNDAIRLEELMQVYRHGMIRKAEAWKIAVQRGLRPPFS